jgi:hypothetical protein
MASVMSLVLTVIVAAVYLLVQKPMRSARL